MTTNKFAKLLFALAVAAGIGSHAVAGPLTPRTDINPAVLYWQAFSLYPDLPLDLRKELWPEPHLPAADAKEPMNKFDPMVEYLRRATRMKVPCDWGVDLSDGPAALIPNLVKVRQASQAVMLRAHYALEAGRDLETADELGAVVVLGRNTGADGTLVSTMLAIAVEDTVNRFVASNFDQFSPQALQSFLKQVDAAPARPTIKHAMSIEKTAFLEWYIAKLDALRATFSGDNAQAMQAARELLTSSLGSPSEVDRIIEKAGNTPDHLIAYFREVEPLSAAIEKAADATPSQLEREANTMRQLAEGSSNLIAQVIFPNVARARRNELGAIVHADMLRAAVTLRLQGEDAFAQLRDPFGNGPFTLTNAVESTVSSNTEASQLPPGFHSGLMRRVQEDAATRRRSRVFWLSAWLTIPRLAFAAAVLCLGILLWTSLKTRSPHNLIARNSSPTNDVARPPRPTAAPLPALSLLSMSRAWNESDAALDQLLASEEKKILIAGDPPLRAWSTATEFIRF